MKLQISAIWAEAVNQVIGANGAIPWDNREDLKYFRKVTLCKTVIMGRKTYQGLPGGRGLPGRENLVLTRDQEFTPTDATAVGSVHQALAQCNTDEVFFIGGGDLLAQVVPLIVNRLYITFVNEVWVGDTVAPPIHWPSWSTSPLSTGTTSSATSMQMVYTRRTY